MKHVMSSETLSTTSTVEPNERDTERAADSYSTPDNSSKRNTADLGLTTTVPLSELNDSILGQEAAPAVFYNTQPEEDRSKPALYRYTTKDIIDGRMVIDPSGASAAASKTTEKATKKPIQNPVSRPAETPVAEKIVEKPSPVSEKSHETAATKRNRAFGGKVLDLLKRTDQAIAYGTGWAISKLPLEKSMQERKAFEAHLAAKYVADENDSKLVGLKKAVMRNQLKIRDRLVPYGIGGYIGAIAVERATMGAMSWFDNSASSQSAPRSVNTEYEMAVSTREFISFESSMLVAGGAGQGYNAPLGELQQKGYDDNVNVMGVEYSAEIGPVVGQERMDDSARVGTADMVAKYDMLSAEGQPVHLVGYSEGSLVAIDAAWEIANRPENGGVLPPDVKLTLIGSPYAQGGIGDSPAGQLGRPFTDAMGIPLDRKLPPGTEVVYFDTDPYANGGNNPTTTLIYDALMLAQGSHGIPDENLDNLRATYTDSDGVIHRVYSNDQMLVRAIETALNMKINNTESAVNAVNAFFPHAVYPGEQVKPDIRAGLHYSAEAVDYQIDPSGNTTIMRDLVAHMPDEWKALGQAGFDGLNTIAQTAADIQTGKVDFMTGANKIMQEIGTMFGGLEDVMKGEPIKGGIDMGINTLASTVKQYTGVDIAPMLQQFFAQAQQNLQSGDYQARINANLQPSRVQSNDGMNLRDIAKPFTDVIKNFQPPVAPVPQAEVHANVGVNVTPIRPVVPPAPAPAPAANPGFKIPFLGNIPAPARTVEQVPSVPTPVEPYVPPAPAPSSTPEAPVAPVAPIAPAPKAPATEVHADVGINLTPIPVEIQPPTAPVIESPAAPATPAAPVAPNLNSVVDAGQDLLNGFFQPSAR